jgi:hypothetical protein
MATFAGAELVAGLVYQTGLGNSTYFGDQAGANDDLTSNNNTGVGYQALKATTTGSYNVASGSQALFSNTTGTGNIASGYQALDKNTTGSYNVASGYQALRFNTTGNYNVASGLQALYYNTIGSTNVASGADSLNKNTTGSFNVASGVSSLFSNTTGTGNVATGYQALNKNTTGNYNVASGYQSGRFINNGTTANETSSNSLYLGANTKSLASGDTNEIVIGYDATGMGSNTVTLGNSSIVTTALRGNVGIGTTSPSVKLDVLADADSNALHLYSTVGATIPRVYTSTSTGDGAFLNSYQGGGGPANYRRLFDIGVNAALAGESAIRFITKAAGVEPAEVVRIDSAGNVGIGTASPAAKLDVVGDIKASGVIKKGVLTVGTLPGSPTAGMSSYVTDSSQTLAAGIGTTLVAGGENFTPVHYNGTNWIIG